MSSAASNSDAENGTRLIRTGGLDLKYGIRSSVVANLTFNTDFADADVDPVRFNITPFRVSLLEKRQFFLENSGVFQFGEDAGLRVLVLEAGSFLASTHLQNLPKIGVPVLRRAWSLRGQQAVVPITGRNAKRVLFATINLRTGHRVCLRGTNMRQENFHALLREVRRRYKERCVWVLLDEAPCHLAAQGRRLAVLLDIHLVWPPKRCSELNAVDQLWKELKGKVSANYQFSSIEEHADYAEAWLFNPTDRDALREASAPSKNFWSQSFLP